MTEEQAERLSLKLDEVAKIVTDIRIACSAHRVETDLCKSCMLHQRTTLAKHNDRIMGLEGWRSWTMGGLALLSFLTVSSIAALALVINALRVLQGT